MFYSLLTNALLCFCAVWASLVFFLLHVLYLFSLSSQIIVFLSIHPPLYLPISFSSPKLRRVLSTATLYFLAVSDFFKFFFSLHSTSLSSKVLVLSLSSFLHLYLAFSFSPKQEVFYPLPPNGLLCFLILRWLRLPSFSLSFAHFYLYPHNLQVFAFFLSLSLFSYLYFAMSTFFSTLRYLRLSSFLYLLHILFLSFQVLVLPLSLFSSL